MIKNVIVYKLFSFPDESQMNYFMNTNLITLKSITGFSIQSSLNNTEENSLRLFRYLKLFSKTLLHDASNYKNLSVFVSWKMQYRLWPLECAARQVSDL